MSSSFQRIAVVGSVGSGKTTLARELAQRIGAPYIELDSLRYQPDWIEVPDQIFREKVVKSVGMDQWVIDGNYASVRDLIWLRAQLLVWIDFPIGVTLWLLLRRTFSRLFRKESFAGGNQEQIGRLFGRQSILVWAIKSHGRRRQQFEELLSQSRYAHLQVVRLHSPSAVRNWLAAMPGPEL